MEWLRQFNEEVTAYRYPDGYMNMYGELEWQGMKIISTFTKLGPRLIKDVG